MNPGSLQAHLREIGVPPQRGRTSAIRQLVLQAPAPVIAKALGYHDKTATLIEPFTAIKEWAETHTAEIHRNRTAAGL
ncbi:hypothetical protein [Streptomyces sp. x-80]|uniref:hypothetical protein n=1 Tax=Streptomyces sp. x-80 TaxID=2789282 RepID=UPI0039811C7F